MDAHLFLADLEEKPARLAGLAQRLRDEDPWAAIGEVEAGVLLLGMGSSHYANQVAAARLRSRGVPAVAELAASDLLPAVRPGTLVVAVSASGSSAETLDAVRRLRAAGAGARFAGLTNVVSTGSTDALGELCDVTVDLAAGRERGGVACRSFQHTLALLLALEERLTGSRLRSTSESTVRSTSESTVRSTSESTVRSTSESTVRSTSESTVRSTSESTVRSTSESTVRSTSDVLERAAAASVHLLDTRADWLPAVSTAALGPDGTHVVAPARRISSALQSALMLREGPRLPAVGCETADWSHVDVYLTKTTDYRLVLLAGSRWEPELLDWVEQRGSTLVAVGGEMPGAEVTVRYPHDDVDDVRLLTETLVAELVAAEAWQAQPAAAFWRAR